MLRGLNFTLDSFQNIENQLGFPAEWVPKNQRIESISSAFLNLKIKNEEELQENINSLLESGIDFIVIDETFKRPGKYFQKALSTKIATKECVYSRAFEIPVIYVKTELEEISPDSHLYVEGKTLKDFIDKDMNIETFVKDLFSK